SAMRLMTDAVESLLAVYEKEDRPDKVIRWQKILIQEQNKIFEKEREYAIEFLDLLKARQEEQALAEAKTLEAQQRARYSGIIALIVSIALAVLSGLAYLLAKNYQKVKSYSKNLGEKNALIGKQIGELKALNEAIMHQNSRLEESNLMKNKLLSIISHDLRTPLVNTKGMLEFINEGLIDPEEREQVFRDLENQYVTVITLLDNLLFWIKGQMESDDFQVASIEIRHLIEQVIREQEVSLKNKGVIAVNEVAPGLTVDGHLEMLKVVFRNLLSNAIKFTDSGSIRFYSSVGEGVSVHVKDAGVGMSAEVLQKVRNRAYFTTPGTKKEAGSGFGLMICKDIISKHDGDLLIDSEPGAGSVFSVKLPLKSRKEKARRQQEIVEN
ncbi:MAG TPA: HAMP domain-containing sensor histidine kinase, partial [Sphingobacteriaceae bacterium]